MPEIAGGHPAYFDPDCPEQLAELLARELGPSPPHRELEPTAVPEPASVAIATWTAIRSAVHA
jgi:hypothetical protein